MNRHMPNPGSTPYEADHAQWCTEQGALLREGRLPDLDRGNLAEEIESLGRSNRRGVPVHCPYTIDEILDDGFLPGPPLVDDTLQSDPV